MTSRRKFLGGLGSVAVAAGVLAGCGYRPGGGDPRWRTSHSSGLHSDDAVGVADGSLYDVAESARGFDFDTHEWTTGSGVVAYDTGDGSERLDLDFDAEMAAHDLGRGGLAVGFDPESDDGDGAEVMRVTAGGVQWRAPVDGRISAIAAAAGRGYAVTTDGRLLACVDGSHEWTADLPETDAPRDEDRGARPAPVVAADADAVVTAAAGTIAGFSPGGRRRWVRRDGAQPESAVVSDGRAFVWAHRDLRALDPSTGETQWTLPGEVESLALTAEGGYRVGDDELVAFDAAGDRRWSAGADRYLEPYRGRVAANADGVYASHGRDLVAHDPTDGSVRWSVAYDRISAGPFAADSGVLVVADGDLVCHYATDRF